MDTFQNMRLFVSVVEAGSFTVVAQNLGISTARVSRAVSGLESRLRARLLERSARRIALTDAGGRYLERCEQILACIDEAEAEAKEFRARPNGKLRIHAMTSIGMHYVVPAIHKYQLNYPEVSVDLTLAQHVPDLLEEGYHISIVSDNQWSKPGYASQWIGRAFSVACASPAYLEKHGIPGMPSDLADHICLRTMTTVSPLDSWSFDGPRGGETVALPPALFQVNSADAMANAVRAGMGIAMLPNYVADGWIESGDIVRIMPDYVSQPTAIYAQYPLHQCRDAKIRTLCNFLRDHPLGLLLSHEAPSESTA